MTPHSSDRGAPSHHSPLLNASSSRRTLARTPSPLALALARVGPRHALTLQEGGGISGVHWVMEPKLIAWHYLRGWFPIDFLSLTPIAFDILPMCPPHFEDSNLIQP